MNDSSVRKQIACPQQAVFPKSKAFVQMGCKPRLTVTYESLNSGPYISSDHQFNSQDKGCALIYPAVRLKVILLWFVACYNDIPLF